MNFIVFIIFSVILCAIFFAYTIHSWIELDKRMKKFRELEEETERIIEEGKKGGQKG